MAHPDALLVREVMEEAALFRPKLGLAEFRDARPVDAPAELLRHQLHPVADAERRDAELEEARVDVGCAVGVDGGRAAGQDERKGVARANLLGGDVVADEFRVDAALPDAARDQL
jgi:hypothetical protein